MKKTVKPIVETNTTKTRKTTKKVNPLYTVNISNSYSEIDTKIEFIYEKNDAGVELSDYENDLLMDDMIDNILDKLFSNYNCVMRLPDGKFLRMNTVRIKRVDDKSEDTENQSKPNLFKRFWNWLCGK